MPIPGGDHDNIAEWRTVIVELNPGGDGMGDEVSSAVGGPISQLSDIVAPPFPDGSIRAECRGMPISAGNRHQIAQADDLHWRGSVRGGAVSQFADAIL